MDPGKAGIAGAAKCRELLDGQKVDRLARGSDSSPIFVGLGGRNRLHRQKAGVLARYMLSCRLDQSPAYPHPLPTIRDTHHMDFDGKLGGWFQGHAADCGSIRR